MNKIPYLLVFVFFIWSCREKVKEATLEPALSPSVSKVDSVIKVWVSAPQLTLDKIADTTFIRLADFSEDFAYELRYATENNFLKTKVYDCAECYTRSKTAKALIAANKVFVRKRFSHQIL